MYQVEASKALLRPWTWAKPKARAAVPRNVFLLGLVSMLTDVSAEMVATVLPLYLVFSLGASPLVLGAIDGLYRGAAALVQVGSGFVSDRWRRPKEVATVGYAISAVCKVGLVAFGSSIGAIGALVASDRIGKGVRTAPRDALISLSSTKAGLATSFGVHRAMDSAGAMLGPLVAFAILLLAPARFDAVFVVSTLFAILGLAVLVLAVQGRPERAAAVPGRGPTPRAAAGVVTDKRFRLLLVAAGGLALASVSDALIYVGLQRQVDFEPTIFPLLYVLTAVVFMALAIPVGRVADRYGRVPVLIAGHALLLAVYAILFSASTGTLGLCLALVALGAYFAATEGVTAALAGAILPEQLQATGMGVLVTVVSVGEFGSSLVFGALWLAIGLQSAVLVFGAALILALVIATSLLMRMPPEPLGE
jgi:MFS transporter